MTDLRLHGYVGEDFTAETVGGFLDANPGPVIVSVNSPGGIAVEGAAILAAFERHGTVSAQIDGLAASAASLMVLGARWVSMHPAALFMIHDPSAATIGRAAAHRHTAQVLDCMTETYASEYARTTGNNLTDIRRWMAAETWLNAEDAATLGFVDEVSTGEPVAVAAFDLSPFSNPPNAEIQETANV